MSAVIFEKSEYTSWSGRYRVETREEDSYWLASNHWYLDRMYDEKESAIARAENIIHRKGVAHVRVIDTEAEGEVEDET